MATADIPVPGTLPAVIGVRGARHNNLRDIDVDVPLWRTVAVVGVSGSGKTSLAMGTLYAEGLHRFLEGLSTYSRRRLTQAQRPDVDRIDHLPPALALRQRPPVPGPRSTVGTMSEVLNVLRLMMSRLGTHLCPNGHRVAPSIATLREEIVCPVCGAHFVHPSAESFAFNSYGACPACQGLGVRSEVDVSTLVPDPDKTIAEGAVLPWNSGGRRLSMYAAGELGVRLDVPYRSLTDQERDIVLRGEPVRQQVTLHSGRNARTVQLSVNYDNAVAAVERSLRSNNERTRRLVQRFVVTRICSVCHGTRLRPEALTSQLGGRNLAEISALSLDELRGFAAGLPAGLPAELSRMTTGLLAELDGRLTPLLDVGLGYLTVDRAGASLSTGERQRIELTSTVRASTTGMLYVLDEPSVGLHPSNVAGLLKTITALAGNGNSVVVVEHEREIIRAADWVIELGPAAGAKGGTVIAQGTPGQLETDPHSIIGPFLAGAAAVTRAPSRPRPGPGGQITLEVGDLYNLHDVTAAFPLRRLTALAGPSGAGKTALVLDSLIPAARALLSGSRAARACPSPGPGRHPPGRPGRRLPDRPERAVDPRDLLRGVRPDPPRVRRVRVRPAAALEARALLVQHPRGAVPDLPRARPHRPRRPVPARHHRRVPDLPRRPLQRRHPGRPGRRPDHRRRARPERGRRPGSGSPTGPRSPRRCGPSARSAWVTCGWASPRRPCPAASRSGCGSPPGCAAASAARCTSSTSRPPACTRSTWPLWSACSTGCWRPGPRSSSSTTTWTCSPPPTTSSTWARAAARTAGTSSPRGRQRTSRGPRAARPGRGWPSTWACRSPPADVLSRG